jgi:hypothetical protein
MNNPNLWYALMALVALLALFVFIFGDALGYDSRESARQVGTITAIWSVVFGIVGVRAQLIQLGRRQG